MRIVRQIGPKTFLVFDPSCGDYCKAVLANRGRQNSSRLCLPLKLANQYHNRTNEDIPTGCIRSWYGRGSIADYLQGQILTQCQVPERTSTNYGPSYSTLLDRVFPSKKEKQMAWFKVQVQTKSNHTDVELHPEVDISKDLLLQVLGEVKTTAIHSLPKVEFRSPKWANIRVGKKRGRKRNSEKQKNAKQLKLTLHLPVPSEKNKCELNTAPPYLLPKTARITLDVRQPSRTDQEHLVQRHPFRERELKERIEQDYVLSAECIAKKETYVESNPEKKEVRQLVLRHFFEENICGGSYFFLEGPSCETLKDIQRTWSKYPQRIDIANYVEDTAASIEAWRTKAKWDFVHVYRTSDSNFFINCPRVYNGIWLDECGSDSAKSHKWQQMISNIFQHQNLGNRGVLAITICASREKKKTQSLAKHEAKNNLKRSIVQLVAKQDPFEKEHTFWKYAKQDEVTCTYGRMETIIYTFEMIKCCAGL